MFEIVSICEPELAGKDASAIRRVEDDLVAGARGQLSCDSWDWDKCSLTSVPRRLSWVGHLATIDLDYNELRAIPCLAHGAGVTLKISWNNLRGAFAFDACGDELECIGNEITEITGVRAGMTRLDCAENKISRISCELPVGLLFLDFASNCLEDVPKLPPGLVEFIAPHNRVRELPDLPDTLVTVHLPGNKISALPKLPVRLHELNVARNQLESLPRLPTTLAHVNVEGNPWGEEFVAALGRLPEEFETAEELVAAVNRVVDDV
jgi:Leucine-rich repeat (LRR) protein